MHPFQPAHFAVIALALLLCACSEDGPVEEPARPAMVVQASAGAAAGTVFAGEVRARHEPVLAFRIGGKISSRRAEIGDRVQAGQVLAELDAADLELRLETARAGLASAEAELELAGAEMERHRNLFDRQLISRSLFEAQQAAFHVAEAQVRQARAQAATADNEAGYAKLRAPAAGVIMQRHAEVGQVVAAGQSVFLFAVDGEKEVAIGVPEQSAAAFPPGRALLVELWATPGQRVPGRLREISPAADSVTRTYAARVSLDTSEIPAELGQSARVYAVESGPASLVLPLSALHARDDEPAVWRVDPQTARVHLTPVRIGPMGETTFPVLDGLAADDWVVAAGVHLLNDGQMIRPVDRQNRPVALSRLPAEDAAAER